MNTPETYNFLSSLNYQLTITRITNLEYFSQKVMWPEVSVNPVLVPTPFQDMRVTGDHMTVSPVTIEFKVDEDMNNYFDLLEWMAEASFPNDYGQYKTAIDNKNLYSDGSIIVYNNTKNVTRIVDFSQMFPIKLSAPVFDTTAASVQYVTCNATFYFQTMKVRKPGDISTVIV